MGLEAPPLPAEALALQRIVNRFAQGPQVRRIADASPDDPRPIVDRELTDALNPQIKGGRRHLVQSPSVGARHAWRHITDEAQRQVQGFPPAPAPGRQVVLAQAEKLVFDGGWQVDGDE